VKVALYQPGNTNRHC